MLTTMKTNISLCGLLLAGSLSASAALYEYDSGAISQAIPDYNYLGTGDALTYSLSGAQTEITALTLTFMLQGGVSTDLSGYLRLGNTINSPSYDLTTLIQSQPLSGTPTSYDINFSTGGFQTAFNGANPNNTWTLFFADTVNGDQTTVTGWTLDITAVPEPTNIALVVLGCLAVGAGGLRQWRMRSGRLGSTGRFGKV